MPDDNNGRLDVFVPDRGTGAVERVSVTSDGAEADGDCEFPAISGDGRYVAFASDATDLATGDGGGYRDVFVHDRQIGVTERASLAPDGTDGNDDSTRPTLSSDGRFIAFESLATNLIPDDTNGHMDVFVHDRQSGLVTRVSVADDGAQTTRWSEAPSRVPRRPNAPSRASPGDAF